MQKPTGNISYPLWGSIEELLKNTASKLMEYILQTPLTNVNKGLRIMLQEELQECITFKLRNKTTNKNLNMLLSVK